jgi:ATP-dependent DNA helicase DinG
LKGRANYFCPRRFENLRRRGPADVDEMRVMAKVLVWLQETKTGDRSEINLNGPAEREVWMRICAEDEGCNLENCLRRTGGNCPFNQARQGAQAAHLLVVNHALLLADVASGSRVLPEYDYLVIDEAHHIEDATTNALSFHVTQSDIDRTLRELGGPTAGMLGWLLGCLADILSPTDYAAVNHLVQGATDLAFHFDSLIQRFFHTIDQFLYEQREGRPVGPYAYQQRIVPATRMQPGWPEIEIAWEDAERTLKPLIDLPGGGGAHPIRVDRCSFQRKARSSSAVQAIYTAGLAELHGNLQALVFKPDPNQIYWVEINPKYAPAFTACRAPAHWPADGEVPLE